MNEEVFDFTAQNGVPFRAVLEPGSDGDKHGPTVAFYDRRWEHTPDGQFTGARYYVSTLTDAMGGILGRGGLNLHGGVSNWAIGPEDAKEVLAWLTRTLA